MRHSASVALMALLIFVFVSGVGCDGAKFEAPTAPTAVTAEITIPVAQGPPPSVLGSFSLLEGSCGPIEGGVRAATVQWSRADGSIAYNIYRRAGLSGEWQVAETRTSATHRESVPAGTDWYYRVVAVGTAGQSAPSNPTERLVCRAE